MEKNIPETTSRVKTGCRHLRSKEMFYATAAQEEDEFSSGIYWCLKTHEGFGPDGEPVGRSACCEGRGCFLS